MHAKYIALTLKFSLKRCKYKKTKFKNKVGITYIRRLHLLTSSLKTWVLFNNTNNTQIMTIANHTPVKRYIYLQCEWILSPMQFSNNVTLKLLICYFILFLLNINWVWETNNKLKLPNLGKNVQHFLRLLTNFFSIHSSVWFSDVTMKVKVVLLAFISINHLLIVFIWNLIYFFLLW